MIRPIKFVNKYHYNLLNVSKNLKTQSIKLYSELKPKNELISTTNNEEKSNLIQELNNKKELNSSLMINEDFIKTLDQKLNPINFKSIAYRQDEINSIMYKIENPFHLFYLYEKYSKDLNSFNLVNFIKKLAYFSNNTNLMNENGQFFVPEKIKSILTKQIIKQAPHFESFQCCTVFQKLQQLGFTLNDYSVKASMQILKFHVNELDLSDLIRNKIILNKFKTLPNGTQTTNEYSDNLEKAFNLAVQVKYEDLKGPKQAIELLKYFSESISDANFEKIIDFIFMRYTYDNPNDLVDLLSILAKRNFTHLKLFYKIRKFLIKSNLEDSQMLKNVHDSFYKLKFYSVDLHDYFLTKQLINMKSSENVDYDILSGLFKSSIFFSHKSIDLLEFSNNNKILTNEQFPISDFLYYSALSNYQKLSDADWEKLVEIFRSRTHDDQTKMQLVKALNWVKQNKLAKQIFESIEVYQNLSINDRLFIKEVYGLNNFKFDENFPSKTKLEEKIESCINELTDQKYEIKWHNTSLEDASYFINFEILNNQMNKKVLVQLAGLNDKFRNFAENTGNYKFRKEYLKNLCDENSRYWVIEVKNYQNMKHEDLLKIVKTKLNELFEK